MLKVRKAIAAFILASSAGLALFGLFSEQAEMFYLVSFVGLILFSGIWPWASTSSEGGKQKLDSGGSVVDLPTGDCRSRMNRGSSGSSSDGTGIEIE